MTEDKVKLIQSDDGEYMLDIPTTPLLFGNMCQDLNSSLLQYAENNWLTHMYVKDDNTHIVNCDVSSLQEFENQLSREAYSKAFDIFLTLANMLVRDRMYALARCRIFHQYNLIDAQFTQSILEQPTN